MQLNHTADTRKICSVCLRVSHKVMRLSHRVFCSKPEWKFTHKYHTNFQLILRSTTHLKHRSNIILQPTFRSSKWPLSLGGFYQNSPTCATSPTYLFLLDHTNLITVFPYITYLMWVSHNLVPCEIVLRPRKTLSIEHTVKHSTTRRQSGDDNDDNTDDDDNNNNRASCKTENVEVLWGPITNRFTVPYWIQPCDTSRNKAHSNRTHGNTAHLSPILCSSFAVFISVFSPYLQQTIPPRPPPRYPDKKN